MISVIVPNYNHAVYLEKRIDSILAQTYQDYELIILDDKSKDQSHEVINKYREHPKVSHIEFNTVNSGSTFKQWYIGIQLAKGDYIWVAESDDWAEPNFLEEVQMILLKYPAISYISTNTNMVTASGEIMQQGYSHTCFQVLEKGEVKVFSGDGFVEEYLYKNCVISNASAVVFRKEYALKYIEQSIHFKLAGDWLFWINMSKGHQVALLNSCLSNFRVHESTVRNTINVQNLILEYYSVLKYIQSHFNASVTQHQTALHLNSKDVYWRYRMRKITFKSLCRLYFKQLYKVDVLFLCRILKFQIWDGIKYFRFLYLAIRNKFIQH